MARRPRLVRRVEIVLCIVGISLLGTALGETLIRRNYQVQQERALLGGPAVSVPVPAAEVPAPEPLLLPAPPPPSVDVIAEPVKRSEKPKPRRTEIDPTAFGRIEIPRLGVAAIVKEGADEDTLARAVGLVRGSARPGEVGNMVLAGHRDTFFRPLRRIRVNDRIRMIVPPNTYEYQVMSMRVVAPEETSVLDSNGVEELTLVTCYPFRYVGPAPDRFIVRAARVN